MFSSSNRDKCIEYIVPPHTVPPIKFAVVALEVLLDVDVFAGVLFVDGLTELVFVLSAGNTTRAI